MAASTSQGERACNSTIATHAPSSTTQPTSVIASHPRRTRLPASQAGAASDPERGRDAAYREHDAVAATRREKPSGRGEQQEHAEHDQPADEGDSAAAARSRPACPLVRCDRDDRERHERPAARRQQEQRRQHERHEHRGGRNALRERGKRHRQSLEGTGGRSQTLRAFCRRFLHLLAGAAERRSRAIGRDRIVERARVEVGPQQVGEIQLGVGELPEQEVADPLLAAGADEQVRLGCVVPSRGTGERLGIERPSGSSASRGTCSTGAPPARCPSARRSSQRSSASAACSPR